MKTLRIIHSIGRKNGLIINNKTVKYTIREMETKIYDGGLEYGDEDCLILGVEKTIDGKLKYLIKWSIKNIPEQLFLIDSNIMRTVYPEMIIEYYEKITKCY